jgi:uncharacterized protein (DUF2147 family)
MRVVARWALPAAFLCAWAGAAQVRAQSASVLGDWVEPTGSVIHIDHCGSHVCLWIVVLGGEAKAKTDIYNPNPSLRGRPLCGLKIGSGFTLLDGEHAADGVLYDPKTGKTYHGRFTAEGAALDLRGYVGIPLFGRSQRWTRAAGPVKGCAPAH